MRLVDGSTIHDGRVEVCINQAWGSICSSGWSSQDVFVVCKQLGYVIGINEIIIFMKLAVILEEKLSPSVQELVLFSCLTYTVMEMRLHCLTVLTNLVMFPHVALLMLELPVKVYTMKRL